MATAPTPTRLLQALVNGAATTAYYASPDVITSRTARGWTKAALTAVMFATAVPDLRAARAEMTARESQGRRAPVDADTVDTRPTGRKVAMAGSVAAVLAWSVGSVVVVERWVFRRGEARAAAGTRLPHTRAALLFGVLAAAISLIPDPSERSGGSAD
jgi:hypothetical protein